MRVKILRRYWNFLFTNNVKEGWDGECDDPTEKRKQIRVRSNLSEFRELETTIHEILHAADWHKDEEWVEKVAEDVSRVLWKIGWRKHL